MFQRLWVSNDLHQESGAQPADWHPARRDFISLHPQCHKRQRGATQTVSAPPDWVGGGCKWLLTDMVSDHNTIVRRRCQVEPPQHKSTLTCEITISLNKQMAVHISRGCDFIHRQRTSKTQDERQNQAVNPAPSCQNDQNYSCKFRLFRAII